MKKLMVISFWFLLAACEKKVDWKLEQGNQSLIVVDGILTNEFINQEVRLTRTFNELNVPPIPIAGAVVSIESEGSVYQLAETASGAGIYRTVQPMQGVVGKAYTLKISLDGKNYSATAQMVPVTPLEPLMYVYSEADSLFEILKISDGYSSNPAMYRISLDWSQVPGYDSLASGAHAELAAYDLNTVDVSQVFRPKKETVLFPEGTIIVERKFSLTSAHAAFLRAMLLETEWRGGYFDEAAANLPTNLSQGAIGFFGASTVTMDTLIVAR